MRWSSLRFKLYLHSTLGRRHAWTCWRIVWWFGRAPAAASLAASNIYGRTAKIARRVYRRWTDDGSGVAHAFRVKRVPHSCVARHTAPPSAPPPGRQADIIGQLCLPAPQHCPHPHTPRCVTACMCEGIGTFICLCCVAYLPTLPPSYHHLFSLSQPKQPFYSSISSQPYAAMPATHLSSIFTPHFSSCLFAACCTASFLCTLPLTSFPHLLHTAHTTHHCLSGTFSSAAPGLRTRLPLRFAHRLPHAASSTRLRAGAHIAACAYTLYRSYPMPTFSPALNLSLFSSLLSSSNRRRPPHRHE